MPSPGAPPRREADTGGATGLSGAICPCVDNQHVVRAFSELERGRQSYARRAWLDAYDALAAADVESSLGSEDLELLARSAYMLGRDDDYVHGLERARDAHVSAGDALRAVRCEFWIGHNVLFRGEKVRARGLFLRARRRLAESGCDGAERGWLLIAVWLEQMAAGDWEAGCATAVEAAAIGERFGDVDLVWLAGRARARTGQGRPRPGRAAARRRSPDRCYCRRRSCRPSSPASSTATRSPSAETPSSSATHASGPMR